MHFSISFIFDVTAISHQLTYLLDLTFYKTGAWNVWQNFKAAQDVQRTIATKANGSLSHAVSTNLISRSDFQLLHRSAHDVRRVPIFALIFVIFGEYTPLVVIYMSNLVPWPCRTPQQILSDRRKLEERRKTSIQNLVIPVPQGSVDIGSLAPQQIAHIARSLGLFSSWTDRLLGSGPLVQRLLRRRIQRRVQYLHHDDQLIQRDGGPQQMEMEEIRMALVERGVDVLGRPDAQL
ncbi:MAG: hypothetical protein M1838_003603, partial [Thelocarpon superellum]